MIKLVNDTISKDDIKSLIDWLSSYPRLTKGNLTIEFEKQWSKWVGTKYSVSVNSGSSANLLMIYSLIVNKIVHEFDYVIVPALSWATTISPIIQFGLQPIICDNDLETFSLDLESLERIIFNHKPKVLLLVHPLGFMNNMKDIISICRNNNIIILEDSCETVGSLFNNKQAGTFGLMSSFSTYFGHTFSTIEGGFINTNNKKLYETLLMLRSHGWDRDLSEATQIKLRKKYNIDNFNSLYSFYIPGFNVRSTDLQAFIGLQQLKRLDSFCQKRIENFNLYQENIINKEWKINPINKNPVNFAYPIITSKRNDLIKELSINNIEHRPLICGSMALQPMIKDRSINSYSPNMDSIYNKSLYIPNHPELKREEILKICNIINKTIN